LSEGILPISNRVSQFERPWPFSKARWNARNEALCMKTGQTPKARSPLLRCCRGVPCGNPERRRRPRAIQPKGTAIAPPQWWNHFSADLGIPKMHASATFRIAGKGPRVAASRCGPRPATPHDHLAAGPVSRGRAGPESIAPEIPGPLSVGCRVLVSCRPEPSDRPPDRPAPSPLP
jgi:hypothetical protein